MTIIYGLLGLGIIIFIHELGHFIAARKCGVEVETFSIGMGPVLLHKKIGTTDYRLSLIPLGGYCGMKGEKMFQEAIEKKLASIPKEKDSFYGVSPIRRIIIAFSGPASNVIFTILALTIIALIGVTHYSTPNKIILATDVYEDATLVAKEAGLQTGDIITRIDGKEVSHFSDISQIVSTAANEKLLFTVVRDSEILELTITPELQPQTGAGMIGVVNWVDPVIANIEDNSPAYKAQLQTNDILLNVAGYTIHNTMDFNKIIQNRDTAHIVFERNGVISETELEIPKNIDGITDMTQIGLSWKVEAIKTQSSNIFAALKQGTIDTLNLITLTFKSIGLLFQGVDLTKAVSGPIGITLMLGETTKTGFEAGFAIGIVTVLNFLSVISISLFIMNLLPIPILDGGLILFSFIELIRGKAVKPTILYKVQFVGLAFILFLFAIGFIGDINRLISGSF